MREGVESLDIYIMKYIDTKIDLRIPIYIYKNILPQTWMGHMIWH